MEVFRPQIKVGLLITLSFILFMVGIFVVSDIKKLWSDDKTYRILFRYADGITRGSPVWYAGFEVGQVTEIGIAKDVPDRIALKIRVNPDARVRQNSQVEIRSLGMMGGKYVEITPGSPESPEVNAAETIEGKNPAALSEIFETGQKVAGQLSDLIAEAHGLVSEFRSESSANNPVRNANAFMDELRQQAKAVGKLVSKLTAFADSLNTTGQNLKSVSGEGGKELTALLRELRGTNSDLQKRLERVETQLNKTLAQVDSGFSEAEGCVKGVRSVVASSEDDIVSLLKNLNETSKHLEALSQDLREHPYKVIWRDPGTLPPDSPAAPAESRNRGRIGPHGKE